MNSYFESFVLLATQDLKAMMDSLAVINKARWAQLTFILSSWDQNSVHKLVIIGSLHGPQQVLREFFFSLVLWCPPFHSDIQLSLLQRIFSTFPSNLL